MKDMVETGDTSDALEDLRNEALAALVGENPDFEGWKAFGRLKSIGKGRTQDPLYLEARIATSVVLQARPTQTMRALDQLRRICEDAGDTSRYFTLVDQVRDRLGEVQLTWHGYKTETFRNWDHAPIWDDLARTVAELRAMGHEVFLHSGTLLGVVRDRRLIDNDDDIDLALVLKAGSATDAAVEWLALTQTLSDAGLLDEETRATRGPETLSLRRANGVLIDLMPCWLEDGRVHILPHTAGELSREDVLPLGTCGITGLPIPANPEAMLAVNYGPNWRIPDPMFVFPHIERRAYYRAFLTGVGM